MTELLATNRHLLSRDGKLLWGECGDCLPCPWYPPPTCGDLELSDNPKTGSAWLTQYQDTLTGTILNPVSLTTAQVLSTWSGGPLYSFRFNLLLIQSIRLRYNFSYLAIHDPDGFSVEMQGAVACLLYTNLQPGFSSLFSKVGYTPSNNIVSSLERAFYYQVLSDYQEATGGSNFFEGEIVLSFSNLNTVLKTVDVTYDVIYLPDPVTPTDWGVLMASQSAVKETFTFNCSYDLLFPGPECISATFNVSELVHRIRNTSGSFPSNSSLTTTFDFEIEAIYPEP